MRETANIAVEFAWIEFPVCDIAQMPAIDDNYPKTIITMVPAYGDGIKGIEVIGLTDFLMKRDHE